MGWAVPAAVGTAVAAIVYSFAGQAAALVCSLAVVVLLSVVQQRRRKRAAAPAVAQATRRAIPPQVPGNGTPLLHGIRVVELSTVIACPSCASQLGVLGAEVVKVEPPRGDMWRDMLLKFEKGRPFSSLFQAANFNKSSVVLDIKTEEGIAKLKRLLADADVFVTNMRLMSLERLGLDEKTLMAEFPHLTCARLTAYGSLGDDALRPGYDIGAFWACTGIAAAVHDQWEFPIYPIGFGDAVCGSLLVAGIVSSLRNRIRTGKGSVVHTSLLHAGLLCNAAQIVDQEFVGPGELKPTDFEAYQPRRKAMSGPLCAPYLTSDGKYLCLLGPSIKNCRERLEQAQIGLVGGEQDAASLTAFFSDRTAKEMMKILDSVGVPYSEVRTLNQINADSPLQVNRKPWLLAVS